MGFKMKYEIKEKYLTAPSKRRSGNKISKVKFVVSHDTGNDGSTADQNVRYYQNSRNEMSASAHIFVDDKEIIECIPALTGKPEKAWHVLYGKTMDNRLYGADSNDAAIGVELCYSYQKGNIDNNEAYKRYIWVVAYICYKFGLNPATKITGHHILDPERKTDPKQALEKTGRSYAQYLKDVVAEYNECIGDGEDTVKFVSTTPSSTLLKKGSKGNDVKALQEKLNKLGFDCGEADGIFGKATLAAIKKLQKEFKLDVDGLVGADTFGAISKALAELDKPKEEVKSEPKEEKKAEVVKEIPKKVDVKINSLGDKYSFQVKAKKDLTVFKEAELTGKVKTLKKNTIFSVYGFDNDGKVFAVGGGNFVAQADVEGVPLHLRTGGLSEENEKIFRAFLKENKIESELNLYRTGNPSADIVVEKLELVAVKKFLDKQGWYYNVK
ncbi:N-acetylmuramoyl-L-alanine amidase [Priestia sp. SB1]|uniref:peptidoglycan recognition protein family protein n=1 Tax=Priestia sp. SB1 TaxID=3132359 RepID=UPI00316DE130